MWDRQWGGGVRGARKGVSDRSPHTNDTHLSVFLPDDALGLNCDTEIAALYFPKQASKQVAKMSGYCRDSFLVFLTGLLALALATQN